MLPIFYVLAKCVVINVASIYHPAKEDHCYQSISDIYGQEPDRKAPSRACRHSLHDARGLCCARERATLAAP